MNSPRHENLTALGLAALGLMLLLGSAALESARADHFLPQHTLDCGGNFPCPDALKPRVRFWVEVFSKWDSNTAVLHDPSRPERVYAVLKNARGCNGNANQTKKRNQVKESLRALAAKIESGDEITAGNERHLARLFPSGNAGKIRAAAKNIRCQSGVRDNFALALKRYNHYRPMVDSVLAENGLPAEIRYLPFVESSYNPDAYSRVGAAGIWQIMPKTARVLGLELNATLDERRDPEAATRAAAKYLKRADQSLSAVATEANPAITQAELNPFIITSYNYGVNGMKRAIREVEPDFMTVLERYKSPRFQIAVKNFYASFLAAKHVARNAERYFGAAGAEVEGGGKYQTVVLQYPTSMTRIKTVFGLRESELRPLNRALTRYAWRSWRLIPAGYRLRLPEKSDNWRTERTKLAALGAEKVISGGDNYLVRRGDTACGIARAVKVNCSELIRVNQLGRKATIYAGQKLLIPGKLVVAAAGNGARTYRVRRGDTACAIAERFGVGCRTLIGHNRLGRKAKIYVGQELSIPGDALASARPSGLNADNQYIVHKGDSACLVAQRFSVGCGALRRLNKLNRLAVIYPGQKLKIPGLVVPETSETAERLAQVDKIRRYALSATEEYGEAGEFGSSPPLPGITTVVSVAGEAAQSGGASGEVRNEGIGEETGEGISKDIDEEIGETVDTLRNLLDTLPDLAIRVSGPADAPVYVVRVEADETLGHFADWLGIGGAGALRKINHLRYGQSIAIGRRLVLPVRDAKMVERFEQRRTDYHQILSEALKEHYDLVGIESYRVKKGDSPWSLSQRLGFPVWLLYRLNPELRAIQLKAGQMVILPKLQEKI